MKRIVILFLLIIGIVFVLKHMNDSMNIRINNLSKSLDPEITTDLSKSPTTIESPAPVPPPVVESKVNVVSTPKMIETTLKEQLPPPLPEPPVIEKYPIEDGKKIAQPGQEVVCETYIPRCVNFQYYFKEVPREMWEQPVSCLSRLSNCIDKSKYEIPSDEEIISIYQAPQNDLEYQEYLKKKREERGEKVEEFSY